MVSSAHNTLHGHILKSNMRRGTQMFPLLANTMSKTTAFTVYKTTNKISPVQHMELIEYIMAANHGLLEKGEVF